MTTVRLDPTNFSKNVLKEETQLELVVDEQLILVGKATIEKKSAYVIPRDCQLVILKGASS